MGKHKPIGPSEVFYAPVVYRELGTKIRKLEKFETASKFFDIAIQADPNIVKSLRERAICRAKICKYDDSLKDCATILESNAEDLETLAVKSLTTYLKTEFEDAMVQNVRLRLQRRKPDHFVVGVMHCEDAIRNCLSERAGHPLRDYFKIIRKMAWKKNLIDPTPPHPREKHRKKEGDKGKAKKGTTTRTFRSVQYSEGFRRESEYSDPTLMAASPMDQERILESLERSKHSQINIPPCPELGHKPIQERTMNLANFMAERYLERMRHEKEFLKHLIKDKRVYCPNEKGEKTIRNLAKRCFKQVQYNQEVLRTRRPFYFLRFQDAQATQKWKILEEEKVKAFSVFYDTEVTKLFALLDNALFSKNFCVVEDLVEKIYQFCKGTERKLLPSKDAYINKVITISRNSLYDMLELNKIMNQQQELTRIGFLLSLPTTKKLSSDSIAIQFKDRIKDRKDLCGVFEEHLKYAQYDEEVIWLNHQLAEYNFDFKKYKIANSYASKCVAQSESIKDYKWMINGLVTLTRCQVSLKNRSEALSHLKHAKAVSKRLHDEKLDKFLERCINIVDEVQMEEVNQDEKLLMARKQMILGLLRTPEMKSKVVSIFQRMESLPQSKRMTLIPGVSTAPSVKKISVIPPGDMKEGEQQIPGQYHSDQAIRKQSSLSAQDKPKARKDSKVKTIKPRRKTLMEILEMYEN